MKKDFSKEEIMSEIDKASAMEELSIPIYTEHLSEIINWTGLSDDDKDKIKEGLEKLARESKGHVILLENVRKIVSTNL